MLVWLLMLAGVIVPWFVIPDGLGEKKKKLIYLSLAFSIIVFVAGSRNPFTNTTTDLYGYYKWYGRAIEMSLSELLGFRLEKGYLVLNDILAWIVPWNQFIYYFEAAFCTGIMFWYIYKNVDDILLGVIVYVCFGPWQFFLTGFRQSIAICLCIIAFELIKKRKTSMDIVSLLIVMLASTMHSTAWVFLLVFVIRYIKPGKNVVIFSGIITLLMFLFIDDLVIFGNDALGRGYVSGRYVGNTFGGLIPIAIYLAALILCYLAWIHDNSIIEDYALDIEMMIFGLCLYILRYNTVIFERISFYFTPVICVVLPVAITRQRKAIERKIIIAVCISIAIILFMYRATQQFGEYEFYWQQIVE